MRSLSKAALLTALLAAAASAQVSVSGMVYDSVAGRPLAGAVVTAADVRDPGSTARTSTSDSTGHYVIAGVSAGTYIVGFLHPALDSLGLEPITRRVTIGAAASTADLAIPGARSLHDTFCKASDTTGAIIGHLRDAISGAPLADGTVVAQWSQITFANGQLGRTLPTLAVTTNAAGWFAFCGLPSGTQIAMQGSHGVDSTGSLRVELVAHTMTRRDLFTSTSEVVKVAAAAGDSVAPPTAEYVHRGNGRASGIIRDAASGKPLAGAQVTVEGTGLSTITNDQGAFSLANLPLGTQVLLARKVGYVPDERAIDLIAATTARVEASLVTVKALLDTVKVVGKRVFNNDRTGFAHREKGGTGRYFNAEQIEKIRPFQTSDLFNRSLATRVDTDKDGTKKLRMRGLMGGYCVPSVYVDGYQYRDFLASDLDNMLHPSVLAGIEIYDSPAMAPPEFSNAFSKCGSVVIWTKR